MKPRQSWATDAHRFRQLRNQVCRDLQRRWIHRHPAVLEVIDEGVGTPKLLRHAEVALQGRCLEGGDVLHIRVATGDGRRQVPIPEQMRVVEAERGDGFEQTVGRMQRQRFVRAEQIEARDIKRNPRAHASGSILRIGLVQRQAKLNLRCRGDLTFFRCSGGSLKAEAVGHIPALGLGELHQNILLCSITGWILHRGIDFVEEREIIQRPLCIEQRALIQRIAGMNLHNALNHVGFGAGISGDENILDEDLMPFGHIEAYVRAAGILRVLGLFDLDMRLLEPVAEVVVEHRVAVSRQGCQAERLPLLRVQQPAHGGLAGLVDTGQQHRSELLLRPFFNPHRDLDLRDLHRLSVGILLNVLHRRGHLDVAEAVCVVERLNRSRIRIQQRAAVTTAAQIGIGLLHLHPFLQQIALEVFVSRKRNRKHLVLGPVIDRIDDVLAGRTSADDLIGDIGVEVPLPLHEVAQVEKAFVEKIVVDRALFEHRNQQMHARPRYLRTFHIHLYDRPLIGVKVVVQQLAFGIVGGLLQGDRGFEAILLQILVP